MAMQPDLTQDFINLKNIPFTVDDGIAARASIGLVVLATDHSVEHEFKLVVNMPGWRSISLGFRTRRRSRLRTCGRWNHTLPTEPM